MNKSWFEEMAEQAIIEWNPAMCTNLLSKLSRKIQDKLIQSWNKAVEEASQIALGYAESAEEISDQISQLKIKE